MKRKYIYVVPRCDKLEVERAQLLPSPSDKEVVFARLGASVIVVRRGNWKNDIAWAGFDSQLEAEAFIRKQSSVPIEKTPYKS